METTFYIGDETFGPFDEAALRSIPAGTVRPRHRVSTDGGKTIRPVSAVPELRFLLESPPASLEAGWRLRLERLRLRYEIGFFTPPPVIQRAILDYVRLIDDNEFPAGMLDEVKTEILRLRRLRRNRFRYGIVSLALIAIAAVALNRIPGMIREKRAQTIAAAEQIQEAFVTAKAGIEASETESQIEEALIKFGRIRPAPSTSAYQNDLDESAARQKEQLRNPVYRLARQLDAFLKDLGDRDSLTPEEIDIAVDRIKAFRQQHPDFEQDLILEGREKAYETAKAAAVARKFDDALRRLRSETELYRGDYETIFREYDRFLRDFTEQNYPGRTADLADVRADRERHVREKADRDRREAEQTRESMIAAVEDAWENLRLIPEERYRDFFDASETFLALPNPEKRHVTEIRRLRAERLVRWDESSYGVFFDSAQNLRGDADMENARQAAKRYLETCQTSQKFDFPGKYRKSVTAWLARLEEIQKDGAAVVFSVTRVEVSGIDVKDRGIQIAFKINGKPAFATDWIPRDLKQPKGGVVTFTAIPANMTGYYETRWDPAATGTMELQVYTDNFGSAWRVTGLRNPVYEYSVKDSRFPFIHMNTPAKSPLELKNKKNAIDVRVWTDLKGLGFPPLPQPDL